MNSITSIIGVTADLRRDFEGDYAAIKTCVFGIDKEEYEALVNKGFKVNPRVYDSNAERFVVHVDPWRVMRVLGTFGYYVPVTPMGGRVEQPTGERRTCIWTLQKTEGSPKINHDA